MKKITWLDINSSYSHSSTVLPLIHAQEAKFNAHYHWDVVKATPKSDMREVIEQLFAQNPDVIAFTSYLFTADFTYQILARIKVLLPSAVLVGGGPEFLGNNEEFLRQHRYIDYVVRGEGEYVFYELLEAVFASRSLQISGLCFLNSQGHYVDNGLARIAEFQALVLSEESCFFDWTKPFVQLETTRGCFNSCKFCVSGNDKPLRTHTLDVVKARIDRLAQRGIQDVRVLDRTFNSNTRRAIDMLSIFEEYPQMNFHLELHPALLNEQINSKLKTLPHGLLHIEAGIQSLDNKVLEASGRKGEKEAALRGLEFLCQLHNIETHTDLIAGLPYYELAQIYSDVNSLASLGSTEIQLETLKLLPGTQMRQQATELGISYSPVPPYEVLRTTHITTAQLREAMLLSRILDIYYNKPVWHSLFRKLVLKHDVLTQHFVAFFKERKLQNQLLSQEKQGIIFFQFLEAYYPVELIDFKIHWILSGFPLKKLPSYTDNEKDVDVDMLLHNIHTVKGAMQADMRIYVFSHHGTTHVFGFAKKGREASKPLFYGTHSV